MKNIANIVEWWSNSLWSVLSAIPNIIGFYLFKSLPFQSFICPISTYIVFMCHVFCFFFKRPKIYFKYQTKLRGRKRRRGGGGEEQKLVASSKDLWPLVYGGIEWHGLVDIGDGGLTFGLDNLSDVFQS